MILSFEAVKTIAMLCQVISGGADSGFTNNVYRVSELQTNCHKFYAKCLQKKSFDDCMIDRGTPENPGPPARDYKIK